MQFVSLINHALTDCLSESNLKLTCSNISSILNTVLVLNDNISSFLNMVLTYFLRFI